MDIKTELQTLVILDDIKENKNLELTIEDNKIILHINKNKIYSSLSNKDVIIGFIHKELNELLDKHLKEMEKLENESRQ